jgi:hypothetical protein
MSMSERVATWDPASPSPLTAWEALQVIARLYTAKDVEGLAIMALYLGEDLALVQELAERIVRAAQTP